MPQENHALEQLASAQQNVFARSQLSALGLPNRTAHHRCAPNGRWQSPLPRVVVRHAGSLSVAQRYWAALLYAAGPRVPVTEWPPQTLITGSAALALYRLGSAPAPEDVRTFDVLVPDGRCVAPLPSVRVLRTRRMPPPTWLEHRLPVAPLLRAVVDATRQERDPAALYEVVRARRITPQALAAELRAARLARRPDIRAVLDDLRAGVRSPAEARARRAVEGAPDLPRPLWNPRLLLDGRWLADPNAYWPRHGVLFEVDSARAHHVEAAGLKVLHASPQQLRERPEAVLADLRAALTGGPYGPWRRVETVLVS